MINNKKVLVVSLLAALSLAIPASAADKTVASNSADVKVAPLSFQEIDNGISALTTHGTPLILNVYFDTDSDKVKPEYKIMLANLNDVLANIDRFAFKVRLIGHTDSRASAAYNLSLGERRATAVKSILAPILHTSVTITGLESKGKTAPIASNDSARGMAANRRVEINVVPSALSLVKANNKVVLSGGGESLLVNDGRQLILWNTKEQCPQNMLSSVNEQIFTSAISPNKLMALSGGASQKLTLWDINTASMLAELTGHQAPISAVAFSHNNRFALSGDLDSDVIMWDLMKEQQVALFSGHTDAITTLALSNSGKYAATGDASGNIHIWDVVNMRKIKSGHIHQGAVTRVQFNERSNLLVSASQTQGMHLWQFEQKDQQVQAGFVEPNSDNKVKFFSMSQDGQTIVASYQNGDIALWHTRTKRKVRTIENPALNLHTVAFTQNDQIVIASDSLGNMHFWDGVTGEHLSKFNTQEWLTRSRFPKTGTTAGETWFDEQTKTKFNWVADGCYDMGCGPWNKNCSAGEKPLHQVCVNGFWLAKHEVSQQQWQTLMGYNPSSNAHNDCEGEECANKAVNQVSWQAAQLYLCKLNLEAGAIYQLPSEAQWEYACREGGQQQQYYGDQTTDDKSGETAGFVHMNEGVWEWVRDAYSKQSYQFHPRHNPVFAGEQSYHFMNGNIYRALRGGAWQKGSDKGQCSRRDYDEPDAATFYSGLRLVKPAN